MTVTPKERKEYLRKIPWVTFLKAPVACEGWHGGSSGKKQCKNLAHYSYKHHKAYKRNEYFVCDHDGRRKRYCWSHLVSRGLYDGMCESRRFSLWQAKHPVPWKETYEG